MRDLDNEEQLCHTFLFFPPLLFFLGLVEMFTPDLDTRNAEIPVELLDWIQEGLVGGQQDVGIILGM